MLQSAAPEAAAPEAAVLSITDTYQRASAEALDWQPDAQLHSARFTISVDRSTYRLGCSYVFLSRSSRKYLIVFLDTPRSAVNFNLRLVDGDWPEDTPIGSPISIEDVHLESQQALELVMNYGARGFFERYRDHKPTSIDLYFLRLERLNDYRGDGPIIWKGGFARDEPHAQLYIVIDDVTESLVNVKAYGPQESEYWFRELAARARVSIGAATSFADYLDIRLDRVQEANGDYYATVTFISPQASFLSLGQITHDRVAAGSHFYFEGYAITLLRIDREWVDIEVLPTVRWYIPTPAAYPR